jgi:alkanesulfonate monooxygenase SsuD/methylene tetrahydromethanopterin reductase-like flavin-dependent oxidoreductase (luciferase family)
VSHRKQIRLAINLLASGRHNASWKTLPDPGGLSTDTDVFIRIAQTAERGLLDGIFLADNYAGLAGESFKRPFRALSPGVLLAAPSRRGRGRPHRR